MPVQTADEVRSELKAWEGAFQRAHGRKPADADIVASAEMGTCHTCVSVLRGRDGH